MVTLWSSIASGGSVFSSGISRPAPRTADVQASRTVKATVVRRIALPFRVREIVLRPFYRRESALFGLSQACYTRADARASVSGTRSDEAQRLTSHNFAVPSAL